MTGRKRWHEGEMTKVSERELLKKGDDMDEYEITARDEMIELKTGMR